jgi:hypothetical protein
MKSIADESTRASTANSVEERCLWLIIIVSVGTMLLYAFRRSQCDIEPKEVGVTPMSTRDKMQAELLRSREELARALGFITLNLSGLEFTIQMFIALLMMKSQAMRAKDDAEDFFQFELAFLISSELPFQRKLTLLESLYKHIETDEKAVSELVKLVLRASNAEQNRNIMIHSSWAGTLGNSIPVRMKQTARRAKNKPTNLKWQSERTSIADVNRVADSLWETQRDLDLFMRSRGYSY